MSETEHWPEPGEVDCADCCVPLTYEEPPEPGKPYLCCDCARKREAKTMKARLAAHEAALADTPENVEATAGIMHRARFADKSEWPDTAVADWYREQARAVLAALRLRAREAAAEARSAVEAAPTNPQPQERP